MAATFLTAEWKKLIMANYSVDPEMLKPYLPYKTELDYYNGSCYLSLVGFLFQNVKVKGFSIPFHTTFEEVNLRFYVKYKSGEEWKRGVVFIKEFVPKPAVAFIANTLYRENYETVPMKHHWQIDTNQLQIAYEWKKKQWNNISVRADNNPVSIIPGSEEEFITEHYWGYARFADALTNEYEVVHPKWDVYPVTDYDINVDFSVSYGAGFSFLNNVQPTSIFVAEGSDITVKAGMKIT